jgi:hypothetical protein
MKSAKPASSPISFVTQNSNMEASLGDAAPRRTYDCIGIPCGSRREILFTTFPFPESSSRKGSFHLSFTNFYHSNYLENLSLAEPLKEPSTNPNGLKVAPPILREA